MVAGTLSASLELSGCARLDQGRGVSLARVTSGDVDHEREKLSAGSGSARDPKWLADVPASAANPLANKVGWFDLNNINCGLLGMPLGFLVIYVVSLMGKAPSKEMQAFIDEIRKPRGKMVLEEKT